MQTKPWYWIDNTESLNTPALAIYPDRVKHNIDLLIGSISEVARLRPHVKTCKAIEPVLLMLESGITKFKCATIAEAEMLAMAKAPDVLLAYPIVGASVDRFLELIKTFPETAFSCLVDDPTSAQILNDAAFGQNLKIPVYIDLNIGMNRTGINPNKAVDLYNFCAIKEALTPMGLHAYDGHIHAADFETRRQQWHASFMQVKLVKQELMAKGFASPKIIAGGTPTFPFYAEEPDVECSPGTFIYWDEGYRQHFTEQLFLPAALLVARVVSLPDQTKICMDLGHKSMASESSLDKRVRFLNAPDLKLISHSEEHLVANAGENHHFKIGDVLYGLPWHICPTVALHQSATTVENHQITGSWETIARNRKITL
ncbi:MAG: D-TA family PLP-dependent enzyme [Mucilaginibacter sp.]|uniref:D-TA family PLP-dependent enzyme n=1 Tax=Mucilaginibacter sp. TaxID=1882438 RepID=UPI0034E4F56A